MSADAQRYSKRSSREQSLKWAWIWFRKLAAHHSWSADAATTFTAEDVIHFLRERRDQGTPAWKRLRIIQGLRLFRAHVQQKDSDDLLPLERTMRDIVRTEQMRKVGGPAIEESHRPIPSNEPDAIQKFRKSMRATGLSLGTEKAYVKKLKAFMSERNLRCLPTVDQSLSLLSPSLEISPGYSRCAGPGETVSTVSD